MIRELIYTSLSEQLAPETILELPGQWIFIQPKESALKLWKEVQAKRFPRLCHTLGILRPHRMASMVEPLYHDILSGVKEKGGRPIKDLANGACTDALKEIAYSGISLTWLCLGQGNMLYRRPVPVVPLVSNTRDARHDIRCRHGWTDSEAFWLIGRVVAEREDAQMVIAHLFRGLPLTELFPVMPNPLAVFDRLCRCIAALEIKPDDPQWLKDAIGRLKASPWRTCILLFVRQGSISHWKIVKLPARMKTARLAYVLNLILDLYGEDEGLRYILAVMQEEAKRRGFVSLAEVVEMAHWNAPDKQPPCLHE